MNPHFLFNSLNTLSCLINDDPQKAEDFLDHMSKVFRYMLRPNLDELVLVETELQFIRSYYYLLKARHEDALQLSIDVCEEERNMLIPPLTLQMIGEVLLTRNSLSRSKPLYISVYSTPEGLEIKSNVQARFNCINDGSDVIDNINNKYCLLCQQPLVIINTGEEMIIRLPLIPNQLMAAV
jgi:LytS/YehU family sensor histidine kinase